MAASRTTGRAAGLLDLHFYVAHPGTLVCGFRCRLLFGASAAEDSDHRVVPLVTGVLVERTFDFRHRDGRCPGPILRGRIFNRIAVVDGVLAHASEPLYNMQIRSGSRTAIERVRNDLVVEIRGVNHERVAFPMPARVAQPQPDLRVGMWAAVERDRSE